MRVLIIRLSSFGDILQTLPAVDALAATGAEVSYLTKSSFAPLLRHHPRLHEVLELAGKGRIADLWATAKILRSKNFTHVYDAHNNLRSLILIFFLRLLAGTTFRRITRSKNRWRRFLFFKLRRPVFKMPFRGADSFIEPLKPWGVAFPDRHSQHLFLPESAVTLPHQPFIALAPSAAWETKRWPVHYWIQLIAAHPELHFVILGGPEDSFCEDICAASPENTVNLAGKLQLLESCAVVAASAVLISGDTGLLHAADQLNKTSIALIGPTAFGYPFNQSSTVLETQLWCKPCSKDGRSPCINSEYQRCMKEITPQMVSSTLRAQLAQHSMRAP